MSATDELRRMLNERGVEYRTHGTTDRTWFEVGYTSWFIFERENGNFTVDAVFLTPEQAIAATLGAGTCKLEEIDKDCDTASEYMLNREWCFDAVYRCSCGCRFGHAAHDRPRYCPNCGRRIEVTSK